MEYGIRYGDIIRGTIGISKNDIYYLKKSNPEKIVYIISNPNDFDMKTLLGKVVRVKIINLATEVNHSNPGAEIIK